MEDRASEEAEVLRDCGSNRHNDGGEVWLHEDEHYTLKKYNSTAKVCTLLVVCRLCCRFVVRLLNPLYHILLHGKT